MLLSSTKTIPCDSSYCNLAAGTITESSLTIICRHKGKRHLTTISLAQLLELFGVEPDIILLTGREKDVIHSAPVVSRHP